LQADRWRVSSRLAYDVNASVVNSEARDLYPFDSVLARVVVLVVQYCDQERREHPRRTWMTRRDGEQGGFVINTFYIEEVYQYISGVVIIL